jgi:hypothetical protein
MKLHNNETVFDNLNTPKRHYPMSSRILSLVLIAIPCLIIVLGLFIDRLPESITTDLLKSISGFFISFIIFLNLFLLKSNPSQLRSASMWTLKSYKKSIAGLDERERQVVDQAYGTSYRIIGSGFVIAFMIIYAIDHILHLTYYPGPNGILFIMFGIFGLVSYLPTAIVAWKEEV